MIPKEGAPDRAIAYPPVEVALLDWWRDHYDHVFVALHPFYEMPDAGPGEIDLDAVKAARTRSWAEVRAGLGEPAPGAFALALWTAVLGAVRPDADARLVDRLERLLASGRVAPPWEDVIPPMFERPLAGSFAALGAAEVTAWDEDREVADRLAVSDLAAPPAIARRLTAYGPFALAAPERGILVTSGHEDLSSLIALTDAARAILRPEERFEGFYAGPSTYCDWINPPDFFDRTPPGSA